MSSHIRIRKSDQSPVTFPTNIVAQGALPHATPAIDGLSEGPQNGERSANLQGEFYGQQGHARIDKLTDDDLLDIFDIYLKEDRHVDKWHTLVHVCPRWRNIVFASPHRLDLRLLCAQNRPARAALDIWPVLPLAIGYHWMGTRVGTWEVQDCVDVIAALQHYHDRVREISLGSVPNLVWKVLAMRVPFPELTSLWIWSGECGSVVPVLPVGVAPRLQLLRVVGTGIPFPAVRNLLLSASDLVNLYLWRLPNSGYISPESMVACLSSLNKLESFDLGFEYPRSLPDQPSSPPQTRVVLPALIRLKFKGRSDYSEDFLARIDTPVLNRLEIFFMDFVFDAFDAAKLLFDRLAFRLELDQPLGLSLEVERLRINNQLNSVARVCGQLSPSFSSIERFELIWDGWNSTSPGPEGKDDVESTQFREIFQLFTAIRSLYVSKTLVPFIASALQELIGDSATEVLPNLDNLFLGRSAISGSIQEDIQPFIEARRLSGRPVTVHHWEGQPVLW
ncbi:hypothetical protein BC826DRAFT_1104661 [Russula brevipes]|nr:hypothetical protein BC826DRAFT_1104661 [Russula brevipes]